MFAEDSGVFNLPGSLIEIQEQIWRPKRHPHIGGIELTPLCNFRCVHCYLQDQKSEKILSSEQIKLIINKLFEQGVLFLYFTGGEIFTRPDFLEIYEYAKRKGFIIELLTNASLINDDAIELFKELPPASINISVYGKDRESYYRVTGHKDAYDSVISNIKKLANAGIHLEIKYIGMQENQEDFFQVKALAEEVGATFTYSMELFPTLKGDSSIKNHAISIDKIIEIERQLPDKILLYKDLGKSRNPFLKSEKPIPLFLCDMAISNFLIDYKGYLNPCHKSRIYKWNLLNCSFDEAWEDFGLIRKEIANPENRCLKCPHIMMCNPCVIVNQLSTGDLNKAPESVCSLTKARVRLGVCSSK